MNKISQSQIYIISKWDNLLLLIGFKVNNCSIEDEINVFIRYVHFMFQII